MSKNQKKKKKKPQKHQYPKAPSEQLHAANPQRSDEILSGGSE
jgi:hypothetical protein